MVAVNGLLVARDQLPGEWVLLEPAGGWDAVRGSVTRTAQRSASVISGMRFLSSSPLPSVPSVPFTSLLTSPLMTPLATEPSQEHR